MTRILILGDVPRGNIYSSLTCFQIITMSLYDAFKKRSDVDVTLISNYYAERTPYLDIIAMNKKARKEFFQPLIDSLPKVDFIVYIDWNREQVYPMDAVRKKTGAKHIVSLLEVPISYVDWSFCFVKWSDLPNYTLINAPCNKSLYQNLPKRKRILIDHYNGDLSNNNWVETNDDNDWTARISQWLTPLKDEYEIIRMTRFDKEIDALLPHEQQLGHQPFGNFLSLTNDVETFIVTHTESYGFGLIDMAARGIRILSPPNFIAPELMEQLGIETFHSEEELRAMVTAPVSDHWRTVIDNLTDYDEIAQKIHEHLCAVS